MRQEGYPFNPNVRLFYWPQKFPPLSDKQIDIIRWLIDTNRDLENYHSLSIVERYKDQRYIRLLKQHQNDISRAVKNGLTWHPLVSEFVYTHKAFGDKEYLRKIKRGWETGVKRPIKVEDLVFLHKLDKIVEYRQQGKTWPQIRQILMRRRIIKKMTWQALYKKFKKAWEVRFAQFNKKAPPIP